MGQENQEVSAQYKEAFARLHDSKTEYYARWYHDRPMAVTSARGQELRELHRVLYKCVAFIAEHFMEYVPRYMPLSEKEMAILELQSRFPYRAGTWRPDFLVSEKGELLLCEITSRFFAHGIFMHYFPETIAERFWKKMEKKPEPSPLQASFDELLCSMLKITDGKQEIFVLKSADKTNEISLYAPFYRAFGKHVEILEAEDVEREAARWKNAFVISALNQKDLLSFSLETIEAMIRAGMYNDLRTILIIHDKRFMNLWFRDEFTGRCLTAQETDFLRRHAVPTYLYCEGDNPGEDAEDRADRGDSAENRAGRGDSAEIRAGHGDSAENAAGGAGGAGGASGRKGNVPGNRAGQNSGIWEDARLHKDRYILKHHRLGKSEKVFAGPLTDEETWESLWEEGEVRDMILQPFIRQRKYPTVWEGTSFEDYICGMMLCLDDRYFGPGMFRASSLPVTNLGDDRKICPVCTDDPAVLPYTDLL